MRLIQMMFTLVFFILYVATIIRVYFLLAEDTMKDLVDFSLHVPSEKGEYGPAEDAHMVLDHLVANYLMRYVKTI
jgi:hypothetical protein